METEISGLEFVLLQAISATWMSQGPGLGAKISDVTRAVATGRVYLILIFSPWGDLSRF